MDGIVGVVLAAGRGTRLRPLTRLRPKALCPVGNVPLVDLALDRVRAGGGRRSRSTCTTAARPRRATSPDDVHRSVEARRAPRHGRRARPPAARGSTGAARSWSTPTPGARASLGTVRRRVGRRARSACSSRATTTCGPPAPMAGALMPWSEVERARGRSPRASTRCRGAAAAERRPARGGPPRRPVRRLRHARQLPGRQPGGQRGRERGGPGARGRGPRRPVRRVAATPVSRRRGAVVLHPRRERASPCSCADARPGLRQPGARPCARRSWPHAASISVPRVRRTVAFTPPARSRSRNVSHPLGGRAPHRVAGRGVERDEVDVGGQRRLRRPLGELARRRWRRSLTPSMSAHSNESRRPFAWR